ncbi:hypothetical protein ACT6NV_14740 [Robiginitalea sp. IMCC44478]|uniref:hypothetical protein n=1 Tax=Robiginitalea sp. IMCC44478 TaxID=3459122 RepID=UPI00404312EC
MKRTEQAKIQHSLSLKIDNNPCICCGEDFKKYMERLFFADVSIKVCSSEFIEESLVVSLKCNMTLLEMMHHLQDGTWGGFEQPAGNLIREWTLMEHLENLEFKNCKLVDIEEFILQLEDTAIIIKRIGPKSIALELEQILHQLAAHYVHTSKGLEETPYEFHIPVMEEAELGTRQFMDPAQDYYKFWGLYYESQLDAKIYDVQGRKLLSDPLQIENP